MVAYWPTVRNHNRAFLTLHMGIMLDDFKTPNRPIQPVRIERIGGLGEGEGRIDGKKIFVPYTASGDVIEVRITREQKDFLRGELVRVVEPSADRVAPPCNWFMQCGGCSLQHLSQSSYRHFKQTMAQEAVRKAGYDVSRCEPCHFLPENSRRRVEFKVQVCDEKRRLGLLKSGSHALVDVDQCLILAPTLQTLLPLLKRWVETSEKAEGLRAIRVSEIDSQRDVVLEYRAKKTLSREDLSALMRDWKVERISVMAEERLLLQEGAIPKKMGDVTIPVAADVFLQASSEGERWLVDQVVAACKEAKTVADLFCGIGTYSFPLLQFVRVESFELDPRMIEMLSRTQHPELMATARDLFRFPLSVSELSRFDAVVINPPREGAKQQSLALAQSTVPLIVMVSCNPATFTRDATILREGGYRLLHAAALDQFVYAPYLELVGVFQR